MVLVAVLSNPLSTGNKSLYPRIQRFCDAHPDIVHYEIANTDEIGGVLESIARDAPRVLVINGGDGTVQATLTELYHGRYFAELPPISVLPSGKTNLIAQDLGATGDPLKMLQRILDRAGGDMQSHIISRELILLTGGDAPRPVLGMFLGGGGLADAILYCRHRIYPLGLPNGISHFITLLATIVSLVTGIRSKNLPPQPSRIDISVQNHGNLHNVFPILMVTTLDRLLLIGNKAAEDSAGSLRLVAVERRPVALLRAVLAVVFRAPRSRNIPGIHRETSNEIRINGDRSWVLFDGEIFEARPQSPIVLRPSAPIPFLSLAS